MTNKRGKEYECPDMTAMINRVARGLARRGSEGDLEAMSALRDAATAMETQMAAAAQGLHAFGYSWHEIGREYGISRQAAQQRWGGE